MSLIRVYLFKVEGREGIQLFNTEAGYMVAGPGKWKYREQDNG